MRDRVFGIETEYAVIYHPAPGEAARPTNLGLYAMFEQHLEERVGTLRRARSLLRSKRGVFLENGCTFHYEATPHEFEHGLIEMASPECRDPFDLLRYERAKDALVEELAHEVNRRLPGHGFHGEVRIGKNNVDSEGHTFGSHESYWIEDRIPFARKLVLVPLLIAAWLITLPVFLWLGFAFVALMLLAIGLGLAPHLAELGVGLLGLFARRWPAATRRAQMRVSGWGLRAQRFLLSLDANPGELARRLAGLERPLVPVVAMHGALYRRFYYQSCLQHLPAFLVTRSLLAGAGAVVQDGGRGYHLAQRPIHLKRLARIFTFGDDRPILELRDPFFHPLAALRDRRRLHLLLGDANLCDVALVLRAGTTALVLEALEESPQALWPELVAPIRALRGVSADPGLRARVTLRDGERPTALALQRRYLEAASSMLERGEDPAPWKRRVLELWRETLDGLERDPASQRERLDWVAKREQIRRDVPDARDLEAIAKRGPALRGDLAEGDREGLRLRRLLYRALRTDLRYHELSSQGGHRRARMRGEVEELVSEAEVDAARHRPPVDTRAHARGEAIREARTRPHPGGATWHRVRLSPLEWRVFRDPLDPGSGAPGA